MVSPYKTNFFKDVNVNGNALKQGTDLVITIDAGDGKDPAYVSGMLFMETSKGSLRAIQAEQTGHRSNPSLDSLIFEMKGRTGQPYPVGKYRVETRWNFGGGDLGIGDSFEIVP